MHLRSLLISLASSRGATRRERKHSTPLLRFGDSGGLMPFLLLLFFSASFGKSRRRWGSSSSSLPIGRRRSGSQRFWVFTSSTCGVYRKRLQSSTCRRGSLLFLVFLFSSGGLSADPRRRYLRQRLQAHLRQLEELFKEEVRRCVEMLQRFPLFPESSPPFRRCKHRAGLSVVSLSKRQSLSNNRVTSFSSFFYAPSLRWTLCGGASDCVSASQGRLQWSSSLSSALSVMGCRQSVFLFYDFFSFCGHSTQSGVSSRNGVITASFGAGFSSLRFVFYDY